MKIYLPTAPSIINPEEGGDSTIQASIRTVQSLVAPFSGTRMFALVYYSTTVGEHELMLGVRATEYTGYGIESDIADGVSE